MCDGDGFGVSTVKSRCVWLPLSCTVRLVCLASSKLQSSADEHPVALLRHDFYGSWLRVKNSVWSCWTELLGWIMFLDRNDLSCFSMAKL